MSHPLTDWLDKEGLTRAELGRRAGCSEAMIRYIEKGGAAGLEVALRLQDVTGLTLFSFFARKKLPKPPPRKRDLTATA